MAEKPKKTAAKRGRPTTTKRLPDDRVRHPVDVAASVWNDLLAVATERDVSAADIVREAIKAYLAGLVHSPEIKKEILDATKFNLRLNSRLQRVMNTFLKGQFSASVALAEIDLHQKSLNQV